VQAVADSSIRLLSMIGKVANAQNQCIFAWLTAMVWKQLALINQSAATILLHGKRLPHDDRRKGRFIGNSLKKEDGNHLMFAFSLQMRKHTSFDVRLHRWMYR
jgi:hypothetical protein